MFADGTSTTRSINENSDADVNIGTAITATDTDNDRLTYTLSGTDAAAFRLESTTGQLKTKAALDYETKSSYTVTITVSDGNLTDTITVTINVTDVEEAILTARFEALPTSHDGSAFIFQLHFSEEIEISYVNVRDDVLNGDRRRRNKSATLVSGAATWAGRSLSDPHQTPRYPSRCYRQPIATQPVRSARRTDGSYRMR